MKSPLRCAFRPSVCSRVKAGSCVSPESYRPAWSEQRDGSYQVSFVGPHTHRRNEYRCAEGVAGAVDDRAIAAETRYPQIARVSRNRTIVGRGGWIERTPTHGWLAHSDLRVEMRPANFYFIANRPFVCIDNLDEHGRFIDLNLHCLPLRNRTLVGIAKKVRDLTASVIGAVQASLRNHRENSRGRQDDDNRKYHKQLDYREPISRSIR